MKGQFRYMGFEVQKFETELFTNPKFTKIDELTVEGRKMNFEKDFDRAIELNNLPRTEWCGNQISIPTTEEAMKWFEEDKRMDAELKKVEEGKDKSNLRYFATLVGFAKKDASFDEVLTFVNGFVATVKIPVSPVLKEVLDRVNSTKPTVKPTVKPDEKPTK